VLDGSLVSLGSNHPTPLFFYPGIEHTFIEQEVFMALESTMVTTLWHGHIDDHPPGDVLGMVVLDIRHPPWKSPLIGVPMSHMFLSDYNHWVLELGLPMYHDYITDSEGKIK
jgi:hypothetical protein